MDDIETATLSLAESFRAGYEYEDPDLGWYRRPDISKLARQLMACDVNVLGTGAHGAVIDCGDYVLKLFNKHDAGFRAFVEFCLAYGESPYLPDIYWVYDVSPLLTCVAMEKLNRCPDAKHDWHVESRRDYKTLRAFIEGTSFRHAARRHWQNITPAFATFARAFREYKEALPKDTVYEDLHCRNVMFRGSQIVITDPWC